GEVGVYQVIYTNADDTVTPHVSRHVAVTIIPDTVVPTVAPAVVEQPVIATPELPAKTMDAMYVLVGLICGIISLFAMLLLFARRCWTRKK
ncbi:MAG: hypothetical protein LKF76_03070, partial [Eggerthellaceae bacterium]|nr:hypothetical protein [Eggerthellaceae bacterium]